jgi:hypothetical protein
MDADRNDQITINIKDGTLFCPHCGAQICGCNEGEFFRRCPHTCFIFIDEMPSFWAYVRADFACSLVDKIRVSTVYLEAVENDDIDPISDEMVQKFIDGDFEPMDETSIGMANYKQYLDKSETISKMLPPNTLIFRAYTTYSGVIIAVD